MKWYNYLFIFIILILLAIFLLTRKEKKEFGFFETEKYKPEQQLISANLKDVDYISLEKKELKSVLIKKDNNWFLEKNNNKKLFPIDETKIENLINELNSIKIDKVASTKAEKFGKFALTDTEAFRLIMKNGDKNILEFLIGENNESFTGTYVRFVNDNYTLLTDRRLTSAIINAKEEFWLNKRIIDEVNINDVMTITLKADEDTKYNLSIKRENKESDTFYLSYDDTRIIVLRDDINNNLINRLSNLTAAAFAEDFDTNIFNKVNFECSINFKDGKNYSFIIGNQTPDNQNYYIKNIAKEYVYLLNKNNVYMLFFDNDIVKKIKVKTNQTKNKTKVK
ncbi:MAG TPA: DUF4340 domain-containing protein [bacterium]|nr:DUF4340 domain-containing protein [bacterium]HOL48753.1 DUF4340 domain-containing protein [bacterium]HPQ19236.1 DUF4340 domain-containing protein [bacterium]